MLLRKAWCMIVLLLLAMTGGGTGFAYPDELGFPLRIGLFQIGVPREVLLEPGDGRIEIFDLHQRQALFSGESRRLTVRIKGDELHLELLNGPKIVSGQRLAFTPIGKGPHFIKIGTGLKNLRAYRGAIEIVPFGGRMLIVNLVPMEEYLRSVVPCEIGKEAPDASLEAQGIAARTYAVRQLKRHASGGFYLCDGQHCQAYGGMRFESIRPSMAVAQTRGLVLTYNGETANSVYHASCGGELKACNKVWGGVVVPYLPAHPDRFGNHAAFCSLPAQPKQGKKAATQRPEAGQYSPQSDRETDAAGWNSLLLWSEAKKAQTQARGHGVGMCQDGAVGMALLGYSRNHILGFYYPGTRLARLSSSMLPPSGSSFPEMAGLGNDRHAFLLKQPPITPPRISSKGGTIRTAAEGKKAPDKGKSEKLVSRPVGSAGGAGTPSPSGISRWFWSNRPPITNPELAAGKTLKIGKKKKDAKSTKDAKEPALAKEAKSPKKTKEKKASQALEKAKETKTTKTGKNEKTSKEVKEAKSTKKKKTGKSATTGKEPKKGKSAKDSSKTAGKADVKKKTETGKNKTGSKSDKKEPTLPPAEQKKADPEPSSPSTGPRDAEATPEGGEPSPADEESTEDQEQ